MLCALENLKNQVEEAEVSKSGINKYINLTEAEKRLSGKTKHWNWKNKKSSVG